MSDQREQEDAAILRDIQVRAADRLERLEAEEAKTKQLQAQHDALYLAVKGEVERYRESAAQHRDRAVHCKSTSGGEEQIRRGLEDDTRADRLQGILDTAGEKREVPDYGEAKS